MDKDHEFYTFRGYALQNQENRGLTPSMEDYLEMIYRLSQQKGYTRINDLATILNVQPPSATRMVQKLAEGKYLYYEKYGIIELTSLGSEIGKKLLERHETLEHFLQLLGVTVNTLEDTEKIEHALSEETIQCIFEFTEFARRYPEWLKTFRDYQKDRKKLPPED